MMDDNDYAYFVQVLAQGGFVVTGLACGSPSPNSATARGQSGYPTFRFAFLKDAIHSILSTKVLNNKIRPTGMRFSGGMYAPH
jgi:hypothetical protein